MKPKVLLDLVAAIFAALVLIVSGCNHVASAVPLAGDAVRLPNTDRAPDNKAGYSLIRVNADGDLLFVDDTGTATNILSTADLFSLNASNLTTGTVPDARFPPVLPGISGANLTNLNASNLSNGAVPDGRFPATLPAVSGANLTNLDASDLGSGTVPDGRLSSNVPLKNAESNSFTGSMTVGATLGIATGIQSTGTGVSGSVAGNAKGTGAVDLQFYRSAASQVASADYAVLIGGQRNAATSKYDVVIGGYDNIGDRDRRGGDWSGDGMLG